MYSRIPLRAAEASAPPAVLDRRLTVLMACATGFAIANIYYNQPLLGVIGVDLGDPRVASLIPTATQFGCALGVLLLVPLGDQVDRRRLIVGQSAALVIALLAAAAAPGPAFLVVASGVVGLLASTAQQVIPFAVKLAPPHARGRAVGTIMSGLLAGIVLARTLSGAVGHWFGWHAVFVITAGLAAAMAAVLAVCLPRSRPAPHQPDARLIASLWHLARTEPGLRRAAATQGLLFASFSAHWTTLALLLQSPRFDLGSDVAGLFGIFALGGVAVAPIAGRLADTGGPDRVVRLGAALVLASFLLMALHADLATLSVGVVLMDAGVQMAMIGNQAAVYAMAGEARGRFNTVFITAMFAIGAAGSAAAGLAWQHGGWPAVMAAAVGPAALALLLQSRPRRP